MLVAARVVTAGADGAAITIVASTTVAVVVYVEVVAAYSVAFFEQVIMMR